MTRTPSAAACVVLPAMMLAALFAGCDRGSVKATGQTVVAASTKSTTPDSSSGDELAPPTAGSDHDASVVEFHPADELSRIAAGLAHGGSSTRTFGRHGSYWYVEARRVRNGVPEVHDDWIDLTVVEAGRATLLSGGRVSGGALASTGEHRGGSIVGGVRRAIGAGDFFVVPAGTPHQFEVGAGDSIRYLTIKVAR